MKGKILSTAVAVFRDERVKKKLCPLMASVWVFFGGWGESCSFSCHCTSPFKYCVCISMPVLCASWCRFWGLRPDITGLLGWKHQLTTEDSKMWPCLAQLVATVGPLGWTWGDTLSKLWTCWCVYRNVESVYSASLWNCNYVVGRIGRTCM